MIYWLTMLGVALFAASGALEAARKKFDLVGVLVIALATAFGGGTLRDLLLNRHPIFWIADPTNLWAALVGTIAVIGYVRYWKPPNALLLIADALGLALFTISGTQLAEQAGLYGIIAVVMGTITGVIGGVLRDVLSTEVPLLFRPTSTLYATAAIAGSTTYLLMQMGGAERTQAALSGMVVVAGLRFLAIYLELHLPGVEIPTEKENM